MKLGGCLYQSHQFIKNFVMTKQEIEDLKRIKNHFGKHSKTMFSHYAFSVLKQIIEKYKPSNINNKN